MKPLPLFSLHALLEEVVCLSIFKWKSSLIQNVFCLYLTSVVLFVKGFQKVSLTTFTSVKGSWCIVWLCAFTAKNTKQGSRLRPFFDNVRVKKKNCDQIMCSCDQLSKLVAKERPVGRMSLEPCQGIKHSWHTASIIDHLSLINQAIAELIWMH